MTVLGRTSGYMEQVRLDPERLALALEAADMVAWEWDPAADEICLSRSADRVLGLPPGTARLAAEELLALVHPEDRERVRQARRRALDEGTDYDEELRLVRPDGSVLWIADKGRVVRSRAGEPGRLNGVLRDITPRRRAQEQAEEAVRRSREHLQFIADSTAANIVHCDAERCFIFVNKAYAARFGLTPDQIVGKPIAEVLGEEAYESLRPYIDRVLAGEPVQYEILINYTGMSGIGRRYMQCAYTPERDAGGRVVGWVGAVTDMTDRHRAEESLREADRRKDEFLATLAHELRNPLAPIRNAVQILRLKGPQDPQLEWSRDVIDRQVQQLTRLVDDLLDVSRITSGKVELRKQRVELSAVLERALETSRPAVDAAHHRLTVTYAEDLPAVLADAARLAQVISNLLNNAAKYTKPGGHIRLFAGRDGERAVIRVSDDGIGIPPEMLSRIFEMFAQVDTSLERSQGGLGLGLTIAKSLVEMHGGTLEAASAGPGRGSELTIRLPVAPEEAAEPAPHEEDGERAPRALLRVLVVDDDEDSAESLAVLLRLKGSEVLTAHDGQQALETAAKHRPDLVLLDIGMPGMSGYEVARRLRKTPETRSAVLVATTGWGQEEDRRRSKEAGFDEHLVKPLDPRLLEDLLARVPLRAARGTQ